MWSEMFLWTPSLATAHTLIVVLLLTSIGACFFTYMRQHHWEWVMEFYKDEPQGFLKKTLEGERNRPTLYTFVVLLQSIWLVLFWVYMNYRGGVQDSWMGAGVVFFCALRLSISWNIRNKVKLFLERS